MTCSTGYILASSAAVAFVGWVWPMALDWRESRCRARSRTAIIAGMERDLAQPTWAERMADDEKTFREFEHLMEGKP